MRMPSAVKGNLPSTGFAEESWPRLLRDFNDTGKMEAFYRQSKDSRICQLSSSGS